MRIEYLADHLELAPQLAAWHYREWQALLPNWSLAEALAELRSHTDRRRIPTTIVAIENDRLAGSASLVEQDLEGWEHLAPWVASVFVIPEFRGRGIARELVGRAVEEAAELGIELVYLFTAGQSGYYQGLGWESWRFFQHAGHDAVIMRRRTSRGR